jgi:hypothetical protein
LLTAAFKKRRAKEGGREAGQTEADVSALLGEIVKEGEDPDEASRVDKRAGVT